MKLGKRSVLWGVHQFVWHPVTVLLAWWYLYGRPSWRELVCIVIHDWGYWHCPNMDGPEGERHPEYGAQLAGRWLGQEYYNLVLYHSRHYARNAGREPSKLCWADKLSIKWDPALFYLFRAWLSGELKEYRQVAADAGLMPLSTSHWQWHKWMRRKFIKLGLEKRGDAIPYGNPRRAVSE